tara:strand:- start:3259 stop:4131 length:873 start_codon:yes stop_codon:yes gene_type:complete
MSIRSIITHPGGAHKDDFLACAVLLADNPVAIERRDPTVEDLSDPEVAVLDIGHQHEPALHNFDHHQFPRDHVPTCALSLVLQHLGLYDDAKNFCEWLEVAEWFDCRGPKDTAEWLGVDRDTLARLNSPVDITLLRRFASQSSHRPGEPVWEVMRMVGSDLVEFITTLRQRLDYIDVHHEIWEIPSTSGTDSFKALFLPRTDPLPEEPSAGIGRYLENKGLSDEVIALVYPDSRGEGFGLRRFNDDPALDFCRIDSQDDVHFAHARGFIAKSSANAPDRLKELLQLAYLS